MFIDSATKAIGMFGIDGFFQLFNIIHWENGMTRKNDRVSG
jgi:hypothetical protein